MYLLLYTSECGRYTHKLLYSIQLYSPLYMSHCYTHVNLPHTTYRFRSRRASATSRWPPHRSARSWRTSWPSATVYSYIIYRIVLTVCVHTLYMLAHCIYFGVYIALCHPLVYIVHIVHCIHMYVLYMYTHMLFTCGIYTLIIFNVWYRWRHH